jgi:hypothetical protein
MVCATDGESVWRGEGPAVDVDAIVLTKPRVVSGGGRAIGRGKGRKAAAAGAVATVWLDWWFVEDF